MFGTLITQIAISLGVDALKEKVIPKLAEKAKKKIKELKDKKTKDEQDKSKAQEPKVYTADWK